MAVVYASVCVRNAKKSFSKLPHTHCKVLGVTATFKYESEFPKLAFCECTEQKLHNCID